MNGLTDAKLFYTFWITMCTKISSSNIMYSLGGKIAHTGCAAETARFTELLRHTVHPTVLTATDLLIAFVLKLLCCEMNVAILECKLLQVNSSRS